MYFSKIENCFYFYKISVHEYLDYIIINIFQYSLFIFLTFRRKIILVFTKLLPLCHNYCLFKMKNEKLKYFIVILIKCPYSKVIFKQTNN